MGNQQGHHGTAVHQHGNLFAQASGEGFVERCQRFVENEEIRLDCERAGERDAPGEAKRQLAREMVSSTLTDSDGRFTLSGIRPGTRWVVVRKIGHEPRRAAADVRPGEVLSMDLVLGNAVTLLKDVIVNADRDAGLKAVGYAARKRVQPGDFMGPEDLENSDRHNLMRVLAGSSRFQRGGCTRYYVDGILTMPGVNPRQYLGGAEIGAIRSIRAVCARRISGDIANRRSLQSRDRVDQTETQNLS